MFSLPKAAVLVLALTLGGCAITVPPDRAKAMSSEQLCDLYKFNTRFGPEKGQALKEELLKRQVISTDDWDAISSGTLRTGMSRLALFCLLGDPYSRLHGKINTTVVGNKKSEQFVYERPSNGFIYVYVTDGLVTGWQH